MKLSISIIYGSVRENRQGIKAVKYLEKKSIERGLTVHLIDPLEYPLPFLNKMFKEYETGTAPHPMQKLSKLFQESDGFLVVTGEYNHSIPPVLKNLLDHFQKEYFFKPSAIASYSTGSFGGVRAVVHLRAILAELGMPSISSSLPFQDIGNFFDSDLKPINPRINKQTNRFLDEFTWYIEALKYKRNLGTPY